MSTIKIVKANNYSENYILDKEDENHYFLINEEGDMEQVKKSNFPLDTIVSVEDLDAFRIIERHSHHQPQLDFILEQRVKFEIDKINKIIKSDFQAYHQSKICYDDQSENQWRLLTYYSPYLEINENCVIDITQHHLNFLEEGIRELVVFVLEEFGVFYVNGIRLRNYLQKAPCIKKNGKTIYKLIIDYTKLMHVQGYETFHEYSNDVEYIKTINERQGSIHPIPENVIGLNSVRHVQSIFDNLKKKKEDFHVITKKKKNSEGI